MGLSKKAKRAKQGDWQRNELVALRVTDDEQKGQIAELRKLVGWLRPKKDELDAIHALCLRAGMVEPSTALDYIRSVFYAFRRLHKVAASGSQGEGMFEPFTSLPDAAAIEQPETVPAVATPVEAGKADPSRIETLRADPPAPPERQEP